MKLQTNQNEVLTNLQTKPHDFTIKQSAAAFEILSSGIYKDPVAAIVRELSCNAFDAHTFAKVTRPFEVHVPTTLEPYFSIRDFGNGLSYEDMLSIYTVYFESTKSNTNEMIGAFGLGAKAPFAYTSAFTVTSYHNGIRTEYSAFVGETGTPQLQRMSETPTTESGLQVKVPVKGQLHGWRSSFHAWEEAVNKYLPYFDPTPVTNYKLEPRPEVLNEGPGYKLLKTPHNSARIIIGNVPYELDTSKIELDYDIKNKLNAFEFYLPIGEIQPTASRESLSYKNQATVDYLTNHIKTCLDDLTSQIAKDIGSLTYWEACLKYGDSPLPISHPSGKRCDRNVQADHVDSIFLKRQLTWRGTRLAGASWQGHVYVKAVANHTLFVYTDNHSRLAEKALYLLKNNQDTKTVVFVKDLAGFDLLGNPPYINASSITLPPKAKSSSTPRSRHRSKAQNLAGLEIEVDFSKPGLYYVKDARSTNFGLLGLVNDHLPKLLNPLPQIVMIVPSKKDSFFKKAVGWKPLKDEMKSLALANLPEKVYSYLYFKRNNYSHGLSYDKFFECKSTKSLSDFAPTEKNESAYAILNQLDGLPELNLPEFNIQHQQALQAAYSKLPSDLKLILNKHNYTPSEVTERFLQLIKEIP